MNSILKLQKPISLFWEPTEKCNLRCKHCYTSSNPDNKPELTFEEAIKIVDSMYDNGIYSLGIGGGEPLIMPFLPSLVKYIRQKGMNVSISTNGLLLTENYLDELISCGLEIIQISIDGLKDNHEYLRGENTYEKVISKVELLNNSGITYRVGSVINSLNYRSLDNFVMLMKSMGVKVINFFRYMPINGNDFLNLTPESLKVATEYLVKTAKLNKYGNSSDKFYITFEPLSFFSFLVDERDLNKVQCTAGKGKFNLSCDGDVTLCNYVSHVVGNMNELNLEEIWHRVRIARDNLFFIPENCESCEFAKICRGGCKGFSYIHGGNFTTKDPACFLHLTQEKGGSVA